MKSVKPGRIVMAQDELKKSGIYIGNFKYVPWYMYKQGGSEI